VGISADPVDRQNEFDQRDSLGFPLLSDPDRSIAASLGAKRIGPIFNRRITFVIDTDRTILAVIKSERDMSAHADEALAVLRARRPGSAES